jgi:hypothetical protein
VNFKVNAFVTFAPVLALIKVMVALALPTLLDPTQK